MRDIKFRYTLKLISDDWGKYREGDIETFFFNLNDEDNGLHRFSIDERWEVLTRDQYTGLKDKNGKGNEVFEGDLFECVFSNIPNGFSSLNTKEVQIVQIATVVYKMGMFQIRVFHPDHDEYVSYPLHDFLKNEQKVVIGNIHQNPELLEA